MSDDCISPSPYVIGKLCIEVTPESKIAHISESLCIGCGICSKVGLTQKAMLLIKSSNQSELGESSGAGCPMDGLS